MDVTTHKGDHMPITKSEPVQSLKLDLRNFRTVPQLNEVNAINAIIATNPDWFWALMESMLEDGYHPTENIIVLRNENDHIVKEGNRRIAALKLILGYISNIDIPDSIVDKIRSIKSSWKNMNSRVPCVVYPLGEAKKVDKLVSLTHAKGEKAGRDKWNAVATARYGRDQKGTTEFGLDILEKYLVNGKNLSPQQAERWAGDYPLTVLNEAIQKLVPSLNIQVKELSQQYPAKNKRILDRILYDIGIDQLGFKEIRDKNIFFGERYGASSPVKPSSGTGASSGAGQPAAGQANPSTSGQAGNKQAAATASNDPRSVRKHLKAFTPKGLGRDKLVTLLNEARRLKLEDHPHAFCFLLRSMFELSAKAYCLDHKTSGGPNTNKPNGEEKHLADLLREIVNYMTNNSRDKAKVKQLHGAMAELAKKDGFLSVTSMNQLIHNPCFSVSPPNISFLFGNVFPLLEAMNL